MKKGLLEDHSTGKGRVRNCIKERKDEWVGGDKSRFKDCLQQSKRERGEREKQFVCNVRSRKSANSIRGRKSR